MMKLAKWAIIIASVANIWIYWGTPAIYGWIVAICGWLPHDTKK